MIPTVLRRAGRLLASARFATVLLLLIGAWSVVASFVPQGGATYAPVAEWASAHPVLEPVVQALGLHQAFSAPLFAAFAIAIAISTALCAWQRTRVAAHRSGSLRDAATSDAAALIEKHDVEIACGSDTDEHEVLTTVERVLRDIGVKAGRRDGVVMSVSPSWSTWGSPVFHWALFAVMAAVLVGILTRSSGLMGLAVGEAKMDVPESYGTVTGGPLHDWRGVRRIIRVEDLDVDYATGGVRRGPTPTVSVLDEAGEVIRSQRVYPNNTLGLGSLTVYPSTYGIATIISMTDANGVDLGSSARLADFSEETTEGTAPASYLGVPDATGKETLKVLIAVPLDRTTTGFSHRVPERPAARVRVTTMDDGVVLDGILRPGETMALPTGQTLKVADIVYYARLQLVDDPSIPLLYAGLAVATVGLGIAAFAKQQIVLATVLARPEGPVLALRLRLWRNASSSHNEIVGQLTRALGGAGKEGTS